MTNGKSKTKQSEGMIRHRALRVALIVLRLALVAVVVAIGISTYRVWRATSEFSGLALSGGPGDPPKRVGIIAGHWESDSGAVCADGLREVDINSDIAERIADLLRVLGYEAEVLPEYSPRLSGYQADVLISIHADSCLREYSGFKVARAAQSAITEEENRLVDCLYAEYEAQTGLARDLNHITQDMLAYHAFYEIAPQTPAVIMEIGYMGGDRRLLTRQQPKVARGVVAGIICFLERGGN